MVIVDKKKCVGCGTCAKVCHEACISIVEKRASIDYSTCSTCTQCIAICAERALSWDGAVPTPFNRDLLPSSNQLGELFGERRTIRDFTQEPLDRELLEEIVSQGARAPTHNFHLRYIVINNPMLIDTFEKASFQFSSRVYRFLFRPWVVQRQVALLSRPIREEFARAKPKLEAAVQRGRGFRSTPAALICVVGDRRVPLSVESAQYALYNMSLYAQVKGIGCQNLVGNRMVFNRNRGITDLLGLVKHERFFAIMGLGYPSIEFKNKVQGKRMQVQWNDGDFHGAVIGKTIGDGNEN